MFETRRKETVLLWEPAVWSGAYLSFLILVTSFTYQRPHKPHSVTERSRTEAPSCQTKRVCQRVRLQHTIAICLSSLYSGRMKTTRRTLSKCTMDLLLLLLLLLYFYLVIKEDQVNRRHCNLYRAALDEAMIRQKYTSPSTYDSLCFRYSYREDSSFATKQLSTTDHISNATYRLFSLHDTTTAVYWYRCKKTGSPPSRPPASYESTGPAIAMQ